MELPADFLSLGRGSVSQLVRVIPQRLLEDSTVRRLFLENLILKWNIPEISKLILIQMTKGYLVTRKYLISLHDKVMVLHR